MPAVKYPSRRKSLEAAAEAALKKIGGRVVKKHFRSAHLSFGKERFHGRELMATVKRGGGEEEVFVEVFHTKGRGIQLWVISNKKDLPKKDAHRFLRSLHALE